LNGRCSDVYKCLKNAVGLQETAKNCKETGSPYRLLIRKLTPYVVLRLADRVWDALRRTLSKGRCSRLPRLQ
jgi:hypothetical protein